MEGDTDALGGFDEVPDPAVLRSEVTSMVTLGRVVVEVFGRVNAGIREVSVEY